MGLLTPYDYIQQNDLSSENKQYMATTTGLAFRDADPLEDDELARICYNAFLPIWLHNWFQCVRKPLEPVSSTDAPLTTLQARRIAFYRSWIALNRAYNGDVIVAYTPAINASSGSKECVEDKLSTRASIQTRTNSIAAVVFLLPPNKRPSWGDLLTAIRTGYFQGLVGFGLRGFWRMVFNFEGNVQRMVGAALKQRGIGSGQETSLLFVQVCVRNPNWQGDSSTRPARALLDWGVRRWWRMHGQVPCWLDCFTSAAEHAYKDIGFELVGECMLETGCDADGLPLSTDASTEVREQGRAVARQRVMLRVPTDADDADGVDTAT